MSEHNMEDPGKGSSSSAYPDATSTTTESNNPSITVSQDTTMPEAEQIDDSDSGLSSVPSAASSPDDPNLLALVRGKIMPDQLVPPRFGSDRTYPFISPTRTSVPFPEGWTEAQKAAAISPNSPYYTMPDPPRVFPPDWTPSQIAAANSPTSPFYVSPGTPITNATPKSPVSLPGLFTHVGGSAPPLQGIFAPRPESSQPQHTPKEQAMADRFVFSGLPLPPGSPTPNPRINPNPGQSLFGQPNSQHLHPSINLASLLEKAAEPGNPASAAHNLLEFVHPATLMLNPPQSADAAPGTQDPPQSATPASSTLNLPLTARDTALFPSIYENRHKNDEKLRIWARPEDRPAALRPVSKLAKFGNVHRSQDGTGSSKRPIGGPDPANAPACATCSKRRDELRAELEPRVRVEEAAKIRSELEPQLRIHVAATMEDERAQKIQDLWEENEKLKQQNMELWCEKDQQSHDHTAELAEQNLEFHGEVDEILKELKDAATIDDSLHQVARLLTVQRALANPTLTPAAVEERAQKLLETQLSTIEHSFVHKHEAELDSLRKDLDIKRNAELDSLRKDLDIKHDAELVKLQKNLEMKHNFQLADNQLEFDFLLGMKQQEVDNLFAEKVQGLSDQPIMPELNFAEWLVEQQEDLDNVLAAKEQDMETEFTTQVAQPQEHAQDMEAEFTTRVAQPQEQAQAQLTQSPEEFQAQFTQQMRREMEEGLKGPIQQQWLAAMQEDMQAHVEQTIRAECEENIRGQVEQRLQAEYEDNIRGQVEQKIRAECEGTIRGQVEQKIRAECEDIIRGQVEQEIRAEAKDVAQSQVKASPTQKYEDDFEEMLTKFDSQSLTDRVTVQEVEKKCEAKILQMQESHQKKLNEEAARIQKKLDAEKAEIQKELEAEKAGLQQKLGAEKAEIQRLEAEKAGLQQKLGAEKVEIQKLEAEKAEIQRKLEAENAEVQKKLEVRKLVAEKAEIQKKLEAEKAGLQQKLDAEKAEIQKLKEEKAEGRKKLGEEKAEIQKKLKTEKAEVQKKLKAEKAEVQKKLEAEKVEIWKTLEAEKAEVQKKLDEEKAGIQTKLDAETAKMQTQYDAQLIEEIPKIQKVYEKKTSAAEPNDTLTLFKENHRAQMAEMQNKTPELKDQIAGMHQMEEQMKADLIRIEHNYDFQHTTDIQNVEKEFETNLAEINEINERSNKGNAFLQQAFEANLVRMQEVHDALLVKEILIMQKNYEEKLSEATSGSAQDLPQAIESHNLPIPIEPQSTPKPIPIQDSSKSVDTQDSSKSVDTQDLLRAKLNEEFAQRFEEARTTMQDQLQGEHNEEYAKIEETVRVEYEEKYKIDSAKLRREIRAEENQAATSKYNEDRIKLEETVRADCQRAFQKQLKDERLELKKTVRAEGEESPRAEYEASASFQRKPEQTTSKTDGQDAKKSAKNDGQDAKKSAKTDGQGAESNPVAKQLRELEHKNKLLQTDLEAERGSLSAVSKQLADSTKREQATAKLCESSQKHVGTLETALQDTNTTLRQTKVEVSAKAIHIVKLQEQVDKALREHKDASTEAKAIQEAAEKELLARHEAEMNLAILKEANDKLLESNNELASGLRAREPEAIQDTLDLVVREKAGLEGDLQRSAAEKDRLESRDGFRQQEIRQCRLQLNALQRNLEAANSRIEAKTRALQVIRQTQAGNLVDLSKLRRENAALADARKKGHAGVPWWVIWLFMLLAFVSAFFFCAFSLFCFLGLAAEREAQHWLGGNDLPQAAIISSISWDVGEWRIW